MKIKRVIMFILIISAIVSSLNPIIYAETETPPNRTYGLTGFSEEYDYKDYDYSFAGTVSVRLYDGLVFQKRKDLELIGSKNPVELIFIRVDNTSDTPYGKGWFLNYQQTLQYSPIDNEYKYINENRTEVYFENSNIVENGVEIYNEKTLYSEGETGAVLFHSTTETYVLSNGLKHYFDSFGRLNRVAKDNEEIAIVYLSDYNEIIDYIEDSLGRIVDFSYDNDGYLEEISVFTSQNQLLIVNGTYYQIQYDINAGDMESVRYNENEVIYFDYDFSGRLIELIDADKTGIEIQYLSNGIRIVTMAALGTSDEEQGKITDFLYDSDNLQITNGDSRMEYQFDSFGRVMETSCLQKNGDDIYQLTLGTFFSYGYVMVEGELRYQILSASIFDENGIINTNDLDYEVVSTEENNILFNSIVDANGNETESSISDGDITLKENYQYTIHGLISDYIDENGIEEIYGYNNITGLPESLTDGENNVTYFLYDSLNQLEDVRKTLENNSMVQCHYQYLHGRVTEIDFEDYSYGYSYDKWGNLSTVYMNNRLLASFDYGTTAYLGIVNSMNFGNGNSIYYTYNNHQQISTISYDGINSRYTYSYGEDGLSSITDNLLMTVKEKRENGTVIMDNLLTEIYSCLSVNESTEENIGNNSYHFNIQRNGNNGIDIIALEDEEGNEIFRTYYSADSLGRITTNNYGNNEIEITYDFEYMERDNNTASNLLGSSVIEYVDSSECISTRNTIDYSYEYDGNGRIILEEHTEVAELENSTGPVPDQPELMMDGFENTISKTKSYIYDEIGRLVEFYDNENNLCVEYAYDSSGNLTMETKYVFLPSNRRRLFSAREYFYINGFLTGYEENDSEISIVNNQSGDIITMIDGNRTTSYYYEEGKRLNRIVCENKSIDYYYDEDGYRVLKRITENNQVKETKYFYRNGRLSAVVSDNDIVKILYDSMNSACGFVYNGEIYYYIKNGTGEIIRIINENGGTEVEYKYSPYGDFTYIGDIFIENINPLVYREYQYDGETGLYYLNNRYYNPEIKRFISSDDIDYINADESVLSNNIFIYCYDDPINREDHTGNQSFSIGGKRVTVSASEIIAILMSLVWYYGKNSINFMITISTNILNDMKSLVSELSKVINKAKDSFSKNSITKSEKHHIVPRTESRNKYAVASRNALLNANLSINGNYNLVFINYWFHRFLHTSLYYLSIWCRIGPDNKQTLRILVNLLVIKQLLSKTSRAYFGG